MRLRILSALIGTVLILILLTNFGLGQESPDLIHQYRDLRGVLFTADIGQAAARLTTTDDTQLDSLAVALTKALNKSKTWNVDHPDWPRVVSVVRADLKAVVQVSKNDARAAQFKTAYEATFEQGLARALTPTELQGLIAFYSSSAGRHFRDVYNQMTKECSRGMLDLKMMMGKGERVGQLAESERTEFSQLASLFSEEQSTQIGIFDPGPGKDRSGLQAIPMMFVMAVQVKIVELRRLWHQLSEEERKSILAFRNSDLGKREQQAVFEAAKGLHGLFNRFGEPNGLGIIETLEALQPKWRALISN